MGSRARLYASTTVHVSSSRQVPYTLGYADLPCGVRILARILGDVDGLAIGEELAVDLDGEGSWGLRRIGEAHGGHVPVDAPVSP